jgi:hypothetical protein
MTDTLTNLIIKKGEELLEKQRVEGDESLAEAEREVLRQYATMLAFKGVKNHGGD